VGYLQTAGRNSRWAIRPRHTCDGSRSFRSLLGKRLYSFLEKPGELHINVAVVRTNRRELRPAVVGVRPTDTEWRFGHGAKAILVKSDLDCYRLIALAMDVGAEGVAVNRADAA
jgi:hypothetical protein